MAPIYTFEIRPTGISLDNKSIIFGLPLTYAYATARYTPAKCGKKFVISTIVLGRCAQIPAIFENLIPRPEEKKDIHRHTHF